MSDEENEFGELGDKESGRGRVEEMSSTLERFDSETEVEGDIVETIATE